MSSTDKVHSFWRCNSVITGSERIRNPVRCLISIDIRSNTLGVLRFIISRLSEASTIRGLIMFFGAMGLSIAPELQEQIITVTIAGSGLVGMVIPDGK